jgi:CRP/FNR family cyclic AMP-dependent transcriptional regulator
MMEEKEKEKEKLGYLSDIELFRDLSDRDMSELDRVTTMTSVPRGRVFYRPEEVGEVLFLVKDGRVQLYRISPEGKKLVIATLGPGTLFGEMALLGQQMHNTFAEALDDCLIYVMSRTDLERLILSKPSVGLRVLEITGRRLRDAEERLEDMAFKGIPARLASLLLRLAAERGSTEIVGLTHQDLAETVGTYRETATQVLNDMKSNGLIDIGRKRIDILSAERLHELAES